LSTDTQANRSTAYIVEFRPTEGVSTDPQEFVAKLNWEGQKN